MSENGTTTFETRMLALNAKGIKTPKTYALKARRAAEILRLANITGHMTEYQDKELAKIASYQDSVLLTLENKPAKNVPIVDGERWLGDEAMERRVMSFRWQLSLKRSYKEDCERRTDECDGKMAAILANIPVGQRNSFTDLLELMEVTTNPPVSDESENLVEVEESVNA